MKGCTSSLQLFLSLAVVMHSARVLPVQSSISSHHPLGLPLPLASSRRPSKNVHAEVLCSVHLPKVLLFLLPYSGYQFSVCADLVHHGFIGSVIVQLIRSTHL